ncbi:MAG TPA: hypothetical protein VLH60_08035 [Sedimentisphaerales bacterium]|nr:hypothetical protein [Sedimentisphaerales bacterium]
MLSRIALAAMITAMLAVMPLAGCRSTELVEYTEKNAQLTARIAELDACNEKNTQLAAQIAELESRIINLDIDILNASEFVATVLLEFQAQKEKLAALEKENQNLRLRLAQTPGSSEWLIQGVDEIRELQRRAVEHAAQQAAADPNKPQ